MFAPTDEAFDTFLADAGISAADLLASPDLADILRKLAVNADEGEKPKLEASLAKIKPALPHMEEPVPPARGLQKAIDKVDETGAAAPP